ncbi:conjugal transfer protein [Pseudomonas sp. LS-2]|nr:conjugal transfer protein [Pseudomonas sp. LS-2]
MLKSYWARMSPTRKRMVVIAVVIGGVLALVTALSTIGGNEKRKSGGKQTIGNVLTDSDPRAVGLDAINATQRQQQKSLTDITRNLKTLMDSQTQQQDLKEGLKDLKAQVNDVAGQLDSTKQTAEQLKAENQQLRDEIKENQAKAPPPEKEAESQQKEAQRVRDQAAQQRYQQAGVDPNKNIGAFFANAPAPAVDPVKPGQNAKKEDRLKITSIGAAAPEANKDKSKEEDVYLPAGSILSGAIITGIDAPTGSTARKDPFPVLLRVKKEAVLPNRFRADVRECFLIASAFGDMSSERAYMRAETISCVRDDGGVIETGLDAYAAGEDGKAGVRGRLISKQGAILARSLMAGFLQGVSEAFSVRQVPSINVTGTGSGSGSSSNRVVSPVYEQAFNSQALQGATIGGTGKALERIADFYLEMAENLYPVIEVDAAREVDFVVKKGVQLKLQTKR